MFRDSMPGTPALAIFDAMLKIFASLSVLAEAGARIDHAPAWARGGAIGFPRLTTLLPLPVAGENRCEKFVHRPRGTPAFACPG